MSNSHHLTSSSSVPASEWSACRSRDEVLDRLLAAATAIFDSDRDQAKVCLKQAAELLRVSLEQGGHAQDESASRGGLSPWQVRRVVAYIESNISLRFCIADLADSVQLSVSHFFRVFKASLGQSPLTYVKMRRIRHAQALMLSTPKPLAQIALDCGMFDQAHFSRVFRQVVGINPSAWRRKFRSDPARAEDTLWQVTGRIGSTASV